MTLAERYFRTQVAGQVEGTIDAKQRDLVCFLQFYVQIYGHDDAHQWYKSVTEAFLKDLARVKVPQPSKQRLLQSTIAYTCATIRRFARWVHHHVGEFAMGCPATGVKAREEEEPKWKGLVPTS